MIHPHTPRDTQAVNDTVPSHSDNTNAPGGCSETCRPAKRPSSWEVTDDMEQSDSDGYTTVLGRGKKKSKVSSESTASTDLIQPTPNSAPGQLFRLFFPQGVTPKERTIWLAEVANRHRNLSVQPRATAKSIIAVTRDPDTRKFLTEVGYPHRGTIMKLTEITEENKQTKVIIKNYPSYLAMDYIEDHPSILWAKRNTQTRSDEPRNQVIAMWKGEPPATLHLPGLRPCKVERFVGKPAFCGRCQRWGHREWQCDHRVRCGFCSQNHDTKICKTQIIAGVAITPKCANCLQEHNAWSTRCPMRPDARPRMDAVTTVPRTVLPAPPAPTTAAFPPLPHPTMPRPWSRLPSSPSTPPKPNNSHPTPKPPPHHTLVPKPALPHMPQILPQPSLPPPLPPTTTVAPPPLPQGSPAPSPSPPSNLEKEVAELRHEVKQLQVSQARLQKENQDLRTLITSLQNVEGEMATMKAMLSQLLQNTSVTKQSQHTEEPSGAAVPMDTTVVQTQPPAPDVTSMSHSVPEAQTQSMSQEGQGGGQMTDDRDLTSQLTPGLTQPPQSPNHPGRQLSPRAEAQMYS